MSPRRRAGRARRSSRRGNAIWLAVSIFVLVGFSALVVDVGQARMVKAQLGLACDAASHAGAAYLDGTAHGMDRARQIALEVAALHEANNEPVEPEVSLGVWEGDAFHESDDPEVVNAVRVEARRDDIAARFAPLAFGRDRMGAANDAIALRPPPAGATRSACYLPLALPSCLLENEDGELDYLLDMTLVLNPTGADNVGWANLDTHPDANTTRNQMLDCEDGGPASTGDEVNLSNGVMTSALQALSQAIDQSDTTWEDSGVFLDGLPEQMDGSSVVNYGNTFEAPILIFESGPEYCEGGGSFVGTEPLIGFAWAVVWDVRWQGQAEDKNLRLRVNPFADQLEGLQGGDAPVVGVLGELPPRIVQ